MKKIIIATGIIVATGVTLAIGVTKNAPIVVPEQTGEALTSSTENFQKLSPRENVQRLYFEPMEIRVPVTTFDFTDEPPMEIIANPNAPLEEE